jgi:hypothetical protein
MSSLFSSPSKQASQAASASEAISQQDIQQAENYVNTSEGQERGAIQGLGANPYIAAGNAMPAPQTLTAPAAVTPPPTQPATVAANGAPVAPAAPQQLVPANAFSGGRTSTQPVARSANSGAPM